MSTLSVALAAAHIIPEARVGQARGWGRKLQSRRRKVEGRELLQQAASPALWFAVLRNPQTGP